MVFDAFKHINELQKLRKLDHEQFEKERAAWKRERDGHTAEIARLTRMVAEYGSAKMGFTESRDTLDLRFSVLREVLVLSKAPEEVFRVSLAQCMDEYRAWMRKHVNKPSTAEVFAQAMSEALTNANRTPSPEAASRDDHE